MKQLLVTFDSDADGTVFSDGGDIITPGGQAIADAIARNLRERGLDAGGVRQRSFYGWEFSLASAGYRYLVVVQQIDRWVVVVGDVSGWRSWMRGQQAHSELERVTGLVQEAVVSTGVGHRSRIETP